MNLTVFMMPINRPQIMELGVNFINIKRVNFLYKRRFGSFFLVTCTQKNDVRTKKLYV